MEITPKIRGQKSKTIRVDPVGLADFRKRLKDSPDWAAYAEASESELHTIAVILASIHIRPEVYVMTLADINHLIDEAVRINIGNVARALGGVAQMNSDKTISVTRPESDSVETFPAKPVQPRRTPMVQ